jgi:hypothetical protein
VRSRVGVWQGGRVNTAQEGVLLLSHQWGVSMRCLVVLPPSHQVLVCFTGWVVQAIDEFSRQRRCRVCAHYLLTSLA